MEFCIYEKKERRQLGVFHAFQADDVMTIDSAKVHPVSHTHITRFCN